MVDAAVSREGTLAILTPNQLCIFPDVTSSSGRDYPIVGNRVCWLNLETVIVMNKEHRLIKQQIQLQDTNGSDSNILYTPNPLPSKRTKGGQDYEIEKWREQVEGFALPPVNTIFTAPVVSLTPPADNEPVPAPLSRKRRVKREELCKEANILRDFVPSHELPSIDKLFDELVQE